MQEASWLLIARLLKAKLLKAKLLKAKLLKANTLNLKPIIQQKRELISSLLKSIQACLHKLSYTGLSILISVRQDQTVILQYTFAKPSQIFMQTHNFTDNNQCGCGQLSLVLLSS